MENIVINLIYYYEYIQSSMISLGPLRTSKRKLRQLKEKQKSWVLDCINQGKSKLKPYSAIKDKFLKYFVVRVPKKKKQIINFTSQNECQFVSSTQFKDFLNCKRQKVLQNQSQYQKEKQNTQRHSSVKPFAQKDTNVIKQQYKSKQYTKRSVQQESKLHDETNQKQQKDELNKKKQVLQHKNTTQINQNSQKNQPTQINDLDKKQKLNIDNVLKQNNKKPIQTDSIVKVDIQVTKQLNKQKNKQAQKININEQNKDLEQEEIQYEQQQEY